LHEAFGAESPTQEHHVAARNELPSRAAGSASRIPAWLVLLPVAHASVNPFQKRVIGALPENAFCPQVLHTVLRRRGYLRSIMSSSSFAIQANSSFFSPSPTPRASSVVVACPMIASYSSRLMPSPSYSIFISRPA
jgi:hypothetical protein